MAQHGKAISHSPLFDMPSGKDENTSTSARELNIPLTPPQEPTDPPESSDAQLLELRSSDEAKKQHVRNHSAQVHGMSLGPKENGIIVQHRPVSTEKTINTDTTSLGLSETDSTEHGGSDSHEREDNTNEPDARPTGRSTSVTHIAQSSESTKLASDGHLGKQNESSSQQGRKSKRLSAERLKELTTSPDSLPVRIISPPISEEAIDSDLSTYNQPEIRSAIEPRQPPPSFALGSQLRARKTSLPGRGEDNRPRNLTIDTGHHVDFLDLNDIATRPRIPRALSTPSGIKSPTPTSAVESKKGRTSLRIDHLNPKTPHPVSVNPPSPMPVSIPLPPLSLPTYLQLELSSHRPSQLYIHRSSTADFPYESSKVKIERLLNFLFLPHQLEGVLWFGTLACLDSWLYTFTILPLRLLKSIYILGQSWLSNLLNEASFVMSFIYAGSQRMWHRRRTRGESNAGVLSRTSSENQILAEKHILTDRNVRLRSRSGKHHKRTKSMPSSLLPDDKADILKSLLIICTTLILLKLDASRMYHWVRGQAAIKLYVIYNLLEVCDRLLSALGQDVLECLFSQEALERKPDGHSKVLRPFWLFVLALVYSVIHSTALFYQVITLNVAVNSYSNALITLLMSVQFVEIKSTVFKKFEKENLFQLTCADIVERFHLWHMMLIIASRNIVETGGLNFGLGALAAPAATSTSQVNANTTYAVPPLTASSILPRSFTIVPSMLSSMTSYVPALGHILGPFVIVLGSEMMIDWLKHAYINKFNNTKPVIYGRFLDVLAKDYYTNAFGNQNLTKRLGLPVIPLSCLMIRAGFQTYQMFVASWMPSASMSASTSLASFHEQYSSSKPLPTSTTGMIVRKMDEIISQLPKTIANSAMASHFTTILVLLLMFLVLLVIKLCLGIGLLAFSRARYRAMKERERNPSHHVDGGRRVGGWGVVEVDEDKRRWIYEDDPTGMRAVRDRELKEKTKKDLEREKDFSVEGIERVKRYEMVAKRIW